MGMSLQDQLLKAGLVDNKQVKKAKKEKHQQHRQKGKNKAGAVAEAKRLAEKAQAEKIERDRLLNQQRKEEAERKAVAAQIRQLVELNRQPKDGEVAYNFVDGNKVKRVYVSEAVHGQLSRGQLVIVRLGGQYEVVPAEVADKIRQRDADCVILVNEPQASGDQGDDPYADYKIPDDLMW